MTVERFVKQLDGCSLCGGAVTGGDNCTCASMAMWLYRASQGKIVTTSCHVRDLTNDCVDGTNLDEMVAIAQHYGISGYTIYKPTTVDHLRALLATGRYGAIIQIDYSPLQNTPHDCFRGGFSGGHAGYLSLGYATAARWGDPGADGRYAGCPNGFANLAWSTIERAAGLLEIDPRTHATMNDRFGYGHIFALLTPRDPDPIPTPAPGGPKVVLSAPTPAERNVMIAQGGLTNTYSHRIALAKGQPLFRYPGGPRVTATSGAISLPYVGAAGTGWRAVVAKTAAPYPDKVYRPTVLYVPAAAGPIIKP